MRTPSETQLRILERAARDLNVAVGEIKLVITHPRDRGCDLWEGTLFHSPEAGRYQRAQTITNQPSEQGLVEAFLARTDMWTPRWQEAFEERVLYRPWPKRAVWWESESPQGAWARCPSGEAMLWAISRPYLTYPASLYRELGLLLLERFGADEGRVFKALADDTIHEKKHRHHVAQVWSSLDDDPTTPEMIRKRAAYAVAMAHYGYTQAFFELAYLWRQLNPEFTDADLAAVIRTYSPEELWTRGYA